MPDAMLQISLNNTHHPKHLAWAKYYGALLVGSQPELPGDCQWCTMLAGIIKHIYGGCDDVAHCPPYMLALWDCQQRTKVLCKEQRQGAAWCGPKNTSRARRRSRSSFRHHSRMLSHMGWSGYSCCSPPNMLPRCHSMAEPFSPSWNTTPKLSSAMSILAYARSSHPVGGMAQASLDDDENGEKDFQISHTPVCCLVWREEGGQGKLATKQVEASGGSPAWQLFS